MWQQRRFTRPMFSPPARGGSAKPGDVRAAVSAAVTMLILHSLQPEVSGVLKADGPRPDASGAAQNVRRRKSFGAQFLRASGQIRGKTAIFTLGTSSARG